jgi:hypothetical protein
MKNSSARCWIRWAIWCQTGTQDNNDEHEARKK